ncbi:MAG TPA: M1 family aminopeptidase [Usitatibacter sp.]|nr:M1 family aminopeptidase [Usitatibacter sp.]
MRTALAIAGFELRTKLARISTAVYFIAFGTLAALWMAAAGGAFQSAKVAFSSDKVYINAPYAIALTVTILGFVGVVTVAAFMGRAIQQDFEYQTSHFFFTSPISKRDYLAGRFVGAAAILIVIFLGITAGVVLGAHWPGVDPERVGPWSSGAFLRAYLVMLLPNVLFLGAVFFTLAALTRRMVGVYIAGAVVLIGYIAAGRLLADIDNRTIAALIDPIGSSALSLATRYWSLAEKNTRQIALARELLWNRALWLAVGIAFLVFCYARFRMETETAERAPRRGLFRRRAAPRAQAAQDEAPARAAPGLPAVAPDTRGGAYLRQLPGLVRLHLRETLKSTYFVAIVVTGALFILGNAKVIGSLYGTNTYPVTYQVLGFASGTFGIFVLVIITLYAGELVWRERDARMALIADSLPVPGWLPLTAKLLTLFAVLVVLQLVVLACGVLIQLFYGYTRIEPGHYLFELLVLELPRYWMLACLAFAVHVAVDQKYLGHFLMVAFYVASAAAGAFGYGYWAYHFGYVPGVVYSDMNGYGDFLRPYPWFDLYWTAACALLLVAARLLWVRGTDTAWRARLSIAAQRASRPVKAAAALAVLVLAVDGAWLYYNTNVLNHYRSEYAQDELRAQYEKSFKRYAARPQPKLTAVRIAVDLFPHRHRVRAKATCTLRNKTGSPIDELYVTLPEELVVHRMEASIPLTLADDRRELSWRRYTLAQPLAPGDSMTLRYDVEYAPRGFANGGESRIVVDNGTFINSGYLPHIGYDEHMELSQDQDRKRHGLAPKPRMHDLDDAAYHQRNYITGEGDWIDFEATISTAPDQLAVAPGRLEREWTENGRRYFHYSAPAPILDFYAFLSARYAVKRDEWRGGGKVVPIEIDYQPGHEYNLEAMASAVKDALGDYTRNFSPYQYDRLRIVEFPRYAAFAQSFPNTIPYSESIGFIARVDPKDPKDIDYPYYVTAHEVSHQWWAHQVVGADVQGATMLSETLAQYSALMVMKHRFGDAKMKRFLKYELDSYLVGRATERKEEEPLYRNENQPYIHYNKGSLVMYALQDYIGEDAVNRALASFVRKWAFRGPPYPTSRDLLAEFRAVTPPQYQYLIADLFETITLYENRAVSATWRRLPDGRYQVRLTVEAKKLRADPDGTQREVPMDDWIDIGVLGKDDAPLYLQKQRIRSGRTTLTLEVDAKPLRAGIDPIVKLVDRRPDDNTVAVSEAGS